MCNTVLQIHRHHMQSLSTKWFILFSHILYVDSLLVIMVWNIAL